MNPFSEIYLMKPKVTEILEAAIPLFGSKGYAATTMRDLASVVNVRAASLYAHIKNKEEVLELLCFGMAEDFFKGLKEIQNKEMVPEKKLRAFAEIHLDLVLKNPEITAVYSQEWRHLGDRKAEFIHLRKQYEKEVGMLLADYKKFETPKQLEFSTRLLLQNLNSAYVWAKSYENATIKSLVIKQIFEGL